MAKKSTCQGPSITGPTRFPSLGGEGVSSKDILEFYNHLQLLSGAINIDQNIFTVCCLTERKRPLQFLDSYYSYLYSIQHYIDHSYQLPSVAIVVYKALFEWVKCGWIAFSCPPPQSEHLCGNCWSTWGGAPVQVLCRWPVDPRPSWGQALSTHLGFH